MWNPTPSTASSSPKRRRRPQHSSTLSPAIAPPGQDTSFVAAARSGKGLWSPVQVCLGRPGSEQDFSDWTADAGCASAGTSLTGDAETDNHLRVRPRRQLDPDEVAQLRYLERLAMQG